MITIQRLALTACASLTLACHAAGISVNPVNGQVIYTSGDQIVECAPSGGPCSEPVTLDFKPVGVAQTTNSKIVLLAEDHLKICDNLQSCPVRKKLPFSDAVGVAVGPSNYPVVLSQTGKLAICEESCTLIP